MKKITILFLLLPLLATAQQKTAGWLTPYADAKFENNKLIYTVCNPRLAADFRLLPLMYPRNLMQLRFDNKPAAVNGKYIGESQTKIRDYVNTEPIGLRSAQEKNEYLRLTAMVLLWDLKLSEFNRTEIIRLKNDADKTISNNADIILQVLLVFDDNRSKIK